MGAFTEGVGVFAPEKGGGGTGGQVDSVVAGNGIDVDSSDPINPVVTVDLSEASIGTLPIASGGTGQTTASAAVDALGGASATGTGGLVRTTSPLLTTPTLAGAQQLLENAGIRLDAALSADGKWTSSKEMAGTAGAALSFGHLCCLASSGKWVKADASDVATAGGVLLGMCVLAAAGDGDPTVMMLRGNIRADAAFPTFTVGATVYISETAGAIVATAPTTTDSVTRVIGHAITADSIDFDPSPDWLTHV